MGEAEATVAPAAAAMASSPPTREAGGGLPPGLNLAANPFVTGATRGSTPPTPGNGVAAMDTASLLTQRDATRVRCPALSVGSGDLPRAHARTLLLEKLSAGAATERRAQTDGTISRMVIFPGEEGMNPARFVTLLVGSRGAKTSETVLGTAIDAHLNSQLDDTRLRQLVRPFALQSDGPLYLPPPPPDGSMHSLVP